MKFKTLKTIHEELELAVKASEKAKKEYYEALCAFDPRTDKEKGEYKKAEMLYVAARERNYRLTDALEDFETHIWR